MILFRFDPLLELRNKSFVFLFFSYFVGTIYFLGFLYALPRFFEYKTEFTRLRLVEKAADSNRTEYVEYLVVVHYLGKSRVYQYCVHLSKFSGRKKNRRPIIFFSLSSSLQCFSKYFAVVHVVLFQRRIDSEHQRKFKFC